MPATQMREITAAKRLDNVRYAIRDLAGLADEVTRQGHKILPLTVGDPNIFDFETPAHVVDAVVKAMRDNKNGYAAFAGDSGGGCRRSARNLSVRHYKHSGCVCHPQAQARQWILPFRRVVNPGETVLTPRPGLSALLGGALQAGH